MDLEAIGLELTELRGLLMRLANDWTLFETWSSAANLDLGDIPGLLPSEGESCAFPARSVEYGVVAPFRGLDVLATGSRLTRVTAPGRTGARGMDVVLVPF